MRPLVLYFNELSDSDADQEQEPDADWGQRVLTIFECLREAAHHHPKVHIAFSNGQWHSILAGKPFSVWIRGCLTRTQYQWLQAKLHVIGAMDDPLVEIYFNGKWAKGLSMAYIANTWAFSFPVSNSPWLSRTIEGIVVSLNGNDLAEMPCSVRHMATREHATSWQLELFVWGREIAEDNLVAMLGHYRIVMYPCDHLPPHVHLISPREVEGGGRGKTVAKFRIDNFERMEGPPSWDGDMHEWVSDNKDHLLACWARCKRGGHPFRVATE